MVLSSDLGLLLPVFLLLTLFYFFCSVDWVSNLPCVVVSGKKRLQLFSEPKKDHNKRMRKMPDLRALVGGDLNVSECNPMAILDGMNSQAPVDPTPSLRLPQIPQDAKS